MDKNIFDERRRALEDAFFTKKDHKLLEELKLQREKQALREASGIENEAVLEHVLQLGLGSEDLAALSLVPLIQVAWADGRMDERERRAILTAAESCGVLRDSAGYQLLNRWMASDPGRSLFLTWKEFAAALAAHLGPQAAAKLRDEVANRARAVAQAAGGILGALALSNAEQRVIDEIERAFE
jgi:uncharacterized membrane protein YebE (DUF533 family)